MNARVPPTDQVDRWNTLPCSLVTGMAYVLRPHGDAPTDTVWAYDITSICGKWSSRMAKHKKTYKSGKEVMSRHWRFVHVLRFDQPMAAPWFLSGMPYPLRSYGRQGKQLLRKVRHCISHELYQWC